MPPDEEEEAVDLEAAARDVWEGGHRLADLVIQQPQAFGCQVQESLLHVLQRHIASLTPDQAQVPRATPLSGTSASKNLVLQEQNSLGARPVIVGTNEHFLHVGALSESSDLCAWLNQLRQSVVEAGPVP